MGPQPQSSSSASGVEKLGLLRRKLGKRQTHSNSSENGKPKSRSTSCLAILRNFCVNLLQGAKAEKRGEANENAHRVQSRQPLSSINVHSQGNVNSEEAKFQKEMQRLRNLLPVQSHSTSSEDSQVKTDIKSIIYRSKMSFKNPSDHF